MATYKLIQDIEAEDHILGPLSLRQFIFALVAVFLFYVNYMLLVKGAAFLLVILLPPALFCAFFAVPFGRDQPTEVWALAKLRFWFKPRRRVWNQSGVKELVTITVPKKVERVLTNGLDQREVSSRLTALANTIDSRGWAVKNVDFGAHSMFPSSSDRLIDLNTMPQEVPSYENYPANDIMDASTSPIARQFDTMINESSVAHRQQLINEMNNPAPSPQQAAPQHDNWFVERAGAAMGTSSPALPAQMAPPPAPVSSAPAPVPTPMPATVADPNAETELSEQLAARSNSSHVSLNNMHSLQPVADVASADDSTSAMDDPQTDQQLASNSPSTAVTSPSDPAILSLANNNDLNVSTLAREAHKAKGDDEVVISLR
ncbi:MAG: PrgI family protein [Patescibacteria group bacterium]